jgi:hypothetical protein
VPGADANCRFYRGRKGDREHPQASWPLGLKGYTLPKVKVPFGTIAIDDSDFLVPFSEPPVYPDADYLMNYKRISMPLYLTSMVTVSAIDRSFWEGQKFAV